MSKPLPSTVKFGLLATAILLAAAGGLAALYPVAVNAAHSQSSRLAGQAAQAGRGEAEADYKLATWLDPHNQPAYDGLARLQLANGHTDAALISLSQAGQGSDVEQLKVRTLLELGRYNEAANEAAVLAEPGRTPGDLQLAVLANALAGRPQDPATTSRLSSPEAAQRVLRAQAGGITLAAELYATGLLRSSSALLTKLPVSFERNLLLADISYNRHTKAELQKAAGLLETAVSLNPASAEAHQLLADVYHDQGNTTAAAEQNTLIAKLRAGQP